MYFGEHFAADCIKAGVVKSSEPMLWHLASTDDRDEENENIHQGLIDISYLVRDGKLTWGHTPRDGSMIDPENVLGNVVAARKVLEGLYTETLLMKSKKRAMVVYEDYNQAPPGIVPYRASIEGSYKAGFDENGMVHKSAIVTSVALDPHVINTFTLGGVLKSLSGGCRKCSCMKSIGRGTPQEKMNLLLNHLIFCRGVKNLATIREILKLKGV